MMIDQNSFRFVLYISTIICTMLIISVSIQVFINWKFHKRTDKKILELDKSIGELKKGITEGNSIDDLREEIKALKNQSS